MFFFMLKLFQLLQSEVQRTELKLAQKLEQRLNQPYASSVFYFSVIRLNIYLVFWQIALDILKFFIVLLADPGNSFNLFFRQRELRSCPFSYYYFKQLQNRVRVFSLTGIGTMVVVAVITSIATNFLFGFKSPGKAASYGWMQSSWVDGADAVAVATPSNLANWARYFLADSNLAATTSIALNAGAATSTATYASDFAAGLLNNVEIVGSGDASISLKRSSAATTFNTNISTVPQYLYAFSQVFVDNKYNKIYAAGGSGPIYKFDSGQGGTKFGDNITQLAGANAQALTVDTENNILYFWSDSSGKLFKYDSGGAGPIGSKLFEYSNYGCGTGQIQYVKGLYLDTVNNLLYGTSDGCDSIFRFNAGTRTSNVSTANWSKLGTVGAAIGQFSDPKQIFIDATSSLAYVADSVNNRIVKLGVSVAGGFSTSTWYTIGAAGNGVGQFSAPSGVSVDIVAGKVYASDYSNNRIVRFDAGLSNGPMSSTTWDVLPEPTGSPGNNFFDAQHNLLFWGQPTYYGAMYYASTTGTMSIIDSIGSGAAGTKALNQPRGIFIDDKYNKLYMVDRGNNRVIKFDSGTGGTTFGNNVYVLGGLSSPQSIAIDLKYDKVYVTEQGRNRVIKFDSGGYGPMSTSTMSSSTVSSPIGVAVDSYYDRVYVIDSSNRRVVKLDSGGAGPIGSSPLYTLGSFGVGVGQFSGPTEVAVDPKYHRVYVVDTTRWEVLKFNSGDAGAMSTTSWSALGDSLFLASLAVDNVNNKLYGISFNSANFYKFDSGGAGAMSSAGKITLANQYGYVAVSTANARVYTNGTIWNTVNAFNSGDPTATYASGGEFISPVINLGLRSNELPMFLSWDETLASGLAGSNQIKLQISSNNENYTDNFDGASLSIYDEATNPTGKWVLSSPVGTAQQQAGGRYLITSQAATAKYPSLLMAADLAGDFDVQVDYDMTGMSISSGSNAQMMQMTAGGKQWQCSVTLTNGITGFSNYTSSATSTATILSSYQPQRVGKLRVVRSGNTVNCWISDSLSSGWINFSRFVGGNGDKITDAAKANLLLGDQDSLANNETVAYDNFIVWGNNSGTLGFYGPSNSTSTYYLAKDSMIDSLHNGAQYLRYKAFLKSDFIGETPSLDAVNISYSYYGNGGPVGLWHFDGVNGSAIADGASIVDYSGFGNNAVASSTGGANMSYADQVGDLDWLGSSYANTASSSFLMTNMDLVPTKVSAEAWIKLYSTPSNVYGIISKRLSGNEWWFYVDSSRRLNFGAWDDTNTYIFNGQPASTTSVLNLDAWYHVAFTYDGQIGKLYVNGILDSSTVRTAGQISNKAPGVQIGGVGATSNRYWNGQIDEVAIYNRPLSPMEIGAHYNQGNPSALEPGPQPSFTIASPFDSQSPANMLAKLSWSEVLLGGTDIRFHIRTSAEGSAWTPWLGPDGTSQTWFTMASGTEVMPLLFKDGATGGTSDQFMQYRAALFSDGRYSPVLDDISLTYVVNGPPEARYAIDPVQSATGSVAIRYEVRDRDTDSGTTPGQVTVSLEYCTDQTLSTTTCPDIGTGSGWATATAVTGDIGLASVDESVSTSTDPIGENSNWTAHELTWLPTVDFPEAYRNSGQFRVRLKIDDNEIVNRYGYATSTTFELDTKKPVINNIAVKADHAPNSTIVFDDITEDTAMEFRLSTDPSAYAGFTDNAGFQALGATTSFDMGNQPTAYIQVRDSRDNRSTTTVTLPDILRMTMIQDTSNLFVNPAEYRLFITWKKPTSSPPNGFSHYNIYRSLTNNAASFELVATGSPMNVNYFTDTVDDTGLTPQVDTWYIVSIEDSRGNTSYRSVPMWGFADGTQNAGEGGGGSSGVAPRISNVASTTYTTSAAISWDTDTRSDSLVYYQSTESCDFTGSTSPVQVVGVATMLDNAGSLGRHQVTVTGLSPATTYYFQPRSTSPTGVAGMTDCVLPGLSFTTAAGPAIVASSTRVVSVGNSSAEIAWQTDLPADSYVVFSANSNLAGSVELGSSDLVTDHVVTLFGLDPGKLYYFQVKSSNDIDSNQGAYYTFATTQDLTPPTISGITSATTDHSAVIQFATAKAATSTVTLTNNTDPAEVWSITIDTLNSNHYFDFSGLSSSTSYTISILARDQNGNAAAATSSLNTAAAPDTAAPVITLPGNFIVTDPTSASISWTTNEQSTSYIQYSTSSVSFETDFKEVGRSEAVTSHSVVLDNLAAGTTYYLRVKSTDPSGNTAYDPATPATYHDFQAVAQPLVISSVATGTVTSNSALVTYSTNHLADTLVRYGTSTGIYPFAQSSIAMTTEHAVTLNGLASSTAYYFQVSSIDGLGQGATSSEYSFTTAAAPIDPTDYQSSLDQIDDLLAQIAALQATASSTGSNDAATIASLQSQVASLQQQLAAANSRGGGGTLIIDKTDKVAPRISDIRITDLKSDSAKVNWKTDEETIGIVNYGKDNDLSGSLGSSAYSAGSSLAITNLEPDSKYSYKISVFDRSGNQASSNLQTFTTPTLEAQLKDEGKSDAEIAKLVEQAENKEENKTNILLAAAAKAMEIMSQVANQVSLGTLETTLLTQFDTIEKLAGSIPGPILGGEPLVVTGASTANISWITDKEASSLVAYAPEGVYIKAEGDNGYLQVVGDANNLSTNHSVRIAGLRPNTTYHYQLRSKAQLGPEAKSRDFTFKTKEEGLEVLTYGSEVKDPSTAVFRWSTNLEADTKLVVTPYRSGKLAVEEAKTEENKITTTMHELTAKDLESGVIYEVRLQSKDAKNRLAEEVIEQFTTSKDDLPPQITNVQTESALSQGKQLKVQTIVSWQTNEPTVGQVQYVKGVVTDDKEFPDKTALETTYSRKHVAVVTKFDSGTVYTFRITATDSSGNKTTSKVYTILTPKQKESVFQLILKNFEDIFGWVGQMGN